MFLRLLQVAALLIVGVHDCSSFVVKDVTVRLPRSVLIAQKRRQSSPARRHSELWAYEGDRRETNEGAYRDVEDSAHFIPFESNPQRPWPLRVLEEPSLNAGRFLVVLAAAIYGTNFATVKMMNEVMPTGVAAVARFGMAALIVTVAVLQSESKAATPEIEEERYQATLFGLEIGAWYAVGYLAQSVGLLTVDASKSAFFNTLAVIVVPVLDAVFKGRKLGLGMTGAIGLAIAGVALLQLGPSAASMGMTGGDFLCLSQAFFFGVGYWRLETAASTYSNQASRLTAGQIIGVAIGALLYCVGSGQVPEMSSVVTWMSDTFVIQSIFWTGLISTSLAIYLETVALKAVSAMELTILMTSVSVWGSAFAYVSMGEVVSPIGMVGGALIMSSCILSATTGGQEETDAPLVVEMRGAEHLEVAAKRDETASQVLAGKSNERNKVVTGASRW